MKGKQIRHDQTVLEVLGGALRVENEERERVNAPTLEVNDVIREVIARFVGVPTDRDIDFVVLRGRLGLTNADFWDPRLLRAVVRVGSKRASGKRAQKTATKKRGSTAPRG